MDLSHVRFHAPGRVPKLARPTRAAKTTHPSIDVGPAVYGLPATVLTAAGLDPQAYRTAPLRRRVPACIRAVRAESETAAQTRLDRDPRLRRVALGNLLIGVSSFFRDLDVFETIEARVLPDLAARTGLLRVLSVGCSFGAEIYSVAMLLAEAQLLDHTALVAIDCREDAIAAARAGEFGTSAMAGLSAERLGRHFEATRTGWTVSASLRHRIDWQVVDATRHVPPGPFDLVLCRNLLMYLRTSTADALCRQLARALTPAGYLVLGKAERPPSDLALTPIARCVHQADGA